MWGIVILFLFALLFGVKGILVLWLAVLWHEGGHALVARLMGVFVQEVSVGFGPEILSIRIGKIRFHLRAIPLGGYMDPADWNDKANSAQLESSEAREVRKPTLWLSNQPMIERIAVSAAGPLSNILLGVAILLLVGVPPHFQGSWLDVFSSVWNPEARAAICGTDLPARVGTFDVMSILPGAWNLGLVGMLRFFAVLNFSLGFLNLIPLPPFDGGRIVSEPFIERATKGLRGEALQKRREQIQNLWVKFAIVGLLIMILAPAFFR